MNNFLCCLSFLCFSLSALSQQLEGTVYLYIPFGQSKKPSVVVRDVAISGQYTTRTTSNKDGRYKLIFDKAEGTTRLSVYKRNLEVVNTNDLKNVEIKRQSILNIYMDNPGATLNRQRELEDAFRRSIERKMAQRIAILEKNNAASKHLKTEVEKTFNRKFNDLYELRVFLETWRDSTMSLIETMTKDLVQKNLDHSNERYNKLIDFIKRGEIDSVLSNFSPTEFNKSMDADNTQIERIQKKQNEKIDQAFAYIPAALTRGLYDSVDYTYQGILKADTFIKKNVVHAGLFYYENNRLKKLKSLISKYDNIKFTTDSSFSLAIDIFKAGLATKENNMLTAAMMLMSNINTNGYDKKDSTFLRFFEEYNLSMGQKILCYNIFFDLITCVMLNMGKLDPSNPINKNNPDDRESLDWVRTMSDSLLKSKPSPPGGWVAQEELDFVMTMGLLMSWMGGTIYEKKSYGTAAQFYILSCLLIDYVEKIANQNPQLGYIGIPVTTLSQMLNHRYYIKTSLLLLSCYISDDKLIPDEKMLKAAENKMQLLTTRNREAFLKEEFELNKSLGIIRFRQKNYFNASRYFKGAMVKLDRLEQLGADVADEKSIISNLLRHTRTK
jgi:hypothetical protein